MGDFCVSGFYSRIPIRNREKVIIIICRRNKFKLGNIPTYLESPLIPMHVPVIGYMNDYGCLDEDEGYEEDETTRMIEGKLNMKFDDIVQTILRDYNKYVSFDEQKDKVKKLFDDMTQMCVPYITKEHYEYTVIYEKYSIYKSMTYEIPKMKECLEYIGVADTVFDEWSGYTSFIKTNLSENYKDYMPYRYCWNQFTQMNGMLSFYDNSTINWKELADKVVEWSSFCISLERQNGMFIPSKYAGQMWHFDEDYVKEQKEILQKMIEEYDNLLEEDY